MHDRFDPQRLRPTQRRPPSTASAANVYCLVECWQGSGLSEEPLSFQTKVVERNGLFPNWNEEVTWQLDNPDACLLRISVYHKGVLKEELLGTDTLPLCALRTGYRSVFLRNAKGLQMELSAILIRLELGERAASQSPPAKLEESECSQRSGSEPESPGRSLLSAVDSAKNPASSVSFCQPLDGRDGGAGSPPAVPGAAPVTRRPSAKQLTGERDGGVRPQGRHGSVAF